MLIERVLADEYAQMVIPTYYRVEKEWREPFKDSAFIQRNPLVLVRYEEFALDDVYLALYEQTGDAVAFAKEYAAFFLAAFEPSLFVSLREDRDDLNKQRISEIFSKQLQTALAQYPSKYSARWWLAVMVIAKR